MRWIFLVIGGIATAAMLLISMRLNFLFGFSLGQSAERAWVFGCVSVISDAWKGLGPVLILTLMGRRRWPSAFGGALIWIVCFIYSMSSALGVAIEDRTARTGGREALQLNYADAENEIAHLEAKRKGLRAHRSSNEIQAVIDARFARPITSGERIRGTVSTASANCRRIDARTVEACAEIAKLREELAAAGEEREIGKRLGELRAQVQQLREHGASVSTDPQAELLARLFHGALSKAEIGPGLSVLLAIMIELVSAFGPAVLATYAEASRPQGQRKEKALGLVVDYLAERAVPGAETDGLLAAELVTDYEGWCRRHDRFALPLAEFVSAFDRLRVQNGLRKIRKRKDKYFGIRLKGTARKMPRA
ncbi:MAG: hypothetical protein WBX25_03420 [Rhodomicrobium sp.]